MNETSPLQKQDITPLYWKLDEIVKILKEISQKMDTKPLE